MSHFPMPNVPAVKLDNVNYRHWNGYNPRIGAFQITGTENIAKAIDAFATYASTTNANRDVALDIETKGADSANWWQITCVTAAFHTHIGVVSVLFNPLREPEHKGLMRRVIDIASRVVFHNCFTGGTEFITRDGVRTLEDAAGEVVEVWTESGWQKAEAKCYGVSSVQKIHLQPAWYRTNIRHTVEATPNHRWPLVDGRTVTTSELVVGDKILAAKPSPKIEHNSDAFKHGLIFADGSLCSRQPAVDGVWKFQMRLCGKKAKWVHLFDNVTYPPSANGDPVVTGKFLFNPKELPTAPDAEYIANFIEGWQLMDGKHFGANRAVSTSAKRHADWLVRHAAAGGWYATGINSYTSGDGSYSPGSVSTTVVLSKGGGTKPVQWKIVGVEDTSTPVPVYCVEVPGVERFTLAEGVYTYNCGFDIPPLVAHRIMSLDDVNKVWDTLVLAKMINTSDRAGRSLEDLAVKYGIVPDDGVKMSAVFSASGLGSATDGFAKSDIGSGTYRDGAMSDTVVTLRLLPLLERMVTDRLDAGTGAMGARLDSSGAYQLVCDMQRVSQIALRRSARGFKIDPQFPEKYRAKTSEDFKNAAALLNSEGLEPGRGDKLVEHLAAIGELPEGWPQTKTGKLSADKKAMELLTRHGSPLSQAHRVVADTTKITGYLDKVVESSLITGRLHPSINTLGASATGRMSVTGAAELHQFPGEARGILVPDHEGGWSSVDWSSIEPVVMAVCAGDNAFLAPFYAGSDLYVPIARAAGLIPPEVDDIAALKHYGRKVAKVVLLAAMYGQGKASLAANLAGAMERKVSLDEAGELRQKIQQAMPVTFAFMKDIERYAESTGTVCTITGRVLNEDAGFTYRAVNHFCITPDTPILTADLRHVRADSVKIGDELVGFDEYADKDTRLMRVADVKNINYVLKSSVEVHTSDGNITTCSEDHRWLVVDADGDHVWTDAGDLTADHRLIPTAVADMGYISKRAVDTIGDAPRVIKVVPVGDREVVAIETSTHTFIANGYLSHNCQGSAADVLYQSTLEIDRQGLSDHIHLWMHDELVVDTPVAAQIDAVMQTPPQALKNWSRADQVILKTDNNAMGMEWKSV